MLSLDSLLTQCHLFLDSPLRNINVRLLSVGQANMFHQKTYSINSPTTVSQNPNSNTIMYHLNQWEFPLYCNGIAEKPINVGLLQGWWGDTHQYILPWVVLVEILKKKEWKGFKTMKIVNSWFLKYETFGEEWTGKQKWGLVTHSLFH